MKQFIDKYFLREAPGTCATEANLGFTWQRQSLAPGACATEAAISSAGLLDQIRTAQKEIDLRTGDTCTAESGAAAIWAGRGTGK